MTCPVCFYPELPYPPRDYHICPCCGTEFGNDDDDMSHAQLRELWIANGAQWFFRNPPVGWNATLQLLYAGVGVRVNPAEEPERPHQPAEVIAIDNYLVKKAASGSFKQERVYMFGT